MATQIASTITTIDFHGDPIFAVERDGKIYVAVAPICAAVGLAVNRQRDRIRRDPILSEGETMMVLPSPGGPQQMLCLPLELIHGWLFTIDDKRVKPGARDRVLIYKRECYRILFEHFCGRALARRRGRALPVVGQDIAGAVQCSSFTDQGEIEASLHPHQLRTLAAVRAIPIDASGFRRTTWEEISALTGGLSLGNVQRNVRHLTLIGLVGLHPEGIAALPPPGAHPPAPETRH